VISGKKAEMNVYQFEKIAKLTNKKGILVMPFLSLEF
jgi:hypothetical protein